MGPSYYSTPRYITTKVFTQKLVYKYLTRFIDKNPKNGNSNVSSAGKWTNKPRYKFMQYAIMKRSEDTTQINLKSMKPGPQKGVKPPPLTQHPTGY